MPDNDERQVKDVTLKMLFSRHSSTPWKREINKTQGRQTVAALFIAALGLFAGAGVVCTLAGTLAPADDVFPTSLVIVVLGMISAAVVLACVGAALHGRRVRVARAHLQAEEERIRTLGRPARATLLWISDFGGEPAQNYAVVLEVEVIFEGFRGRSYRIECGSIVPSVHSGRLRLHETVPVVVDPEHEDNIRILWDQP